MHARIFLIYALAHTSKSACHINRFHDSLGGGGAKRKQSDVSRLRAAYLSALPPLSSGAQDEALLLKASKYLSQAPSNGMGEYWL